MEILRSVKEFGPVKLLARVWDVMGGSIDEYSRLAHPEIQHPENDRLIEARRRRQLALSMAENSSNNGNASLKVRNILTRGEI